MNIGSLTVGGIVNNVKVFTDILNARGKHMRHTFLQDHKFVKGQPETGAD